MYRRTTAVSLLTAMLILGGATAAWADAGQFVRQAYGVVFYYGVSSGNSDSYDFSGGPVFRVCQDAPGVSYSATAYSQLQWNRTLQPDDTVREVYSHYYEPERCSAGYDSSSSNTYHVRVDWNHAPAAPDRNTGYGRAE